VNVRTLRFDEQRGICVGASGDRVTLADGDASVTAQKPRLKEAVD
jgi:hypothetical protein